MPGLKPGLRLLSFASFLPGTLNPIQNRLETNGSPDAAFLSTDADGAKWYIGNIPELVLGGAKGRVTVAWASARVVVSFQDTQSPPWEVEATAEPKLVEIPSPSRRSVVPKGGSRRVLSCSGVTKHFIQREAFIAVFRVCRSLGAQQWAVGWCLPVRLWMRGSAVACQYLAGLLRRRLRCGQR